MPAWAIVSTARENPSLVRHAWPTARTPKRRVVAGDYQSARPFPELKPRPCWPVWVLSLAYVLRSELRLVKLISPRSGWISTGIGLAAAVSFANALSIGPAPGCCLLVPFLALRMPASEWVSYALALSLGVAAWVSGSSHRRRSGSAYDRGEVGYFWTVFWIFDGRNAGVAVVLFGMSLQVAWLLFFSMLLSSPHCDPHAICLL